MRTLPLLLVVGLLFTSLAKAQTPSYPTPVPTMSPAQMAEFKETHLIYNDSDLFGMHYYLNGREIDTDLQMEKILAGAEDEEVMRQWKAAQDKSGLGWVLVAGGSGMVAAGGVLSWQGNSNATLYNILVIGGLGVDILGGLFWREAQMDQRGAVSRYNQIVREDNGLSLLDLKGQGTGLAYLQRF